MAIAESGNLRGVLSNRIDLGLANRATWLAGVFVRVEMTDGATDDYGYKAVENKVEIHDLHATMLHRPGLIHDRLTYRFGGRDYRLTDAHTQVVKAVLAETWNP